MSLLPVLACHSPSPSTQVHSCLHQLKHSEAGPVLIWLHLFVLAAGCADSAHLPSSMWFSGTGKNGKQLKMGQAEGNGAYQTCLFCCPSPGELSALREEGHEVAKAMRKKLFQCITCGFGWISPEFLGYYCVKLHICTLERHGGHKLFSHREPRQVYNLPPPHSCGQSGTKWAMEEEGRSRDLLNSSPKRSKM